MPHQEVYQREAEPLLKDLGFGVVGSQSGLQCKGVELGGFREGTVFTSQRPGDIWKFVKINLPLKILPATILPLLKGSLSRLQVSAVLV